ncbi:MAG: hypothetical protein HYV63_28600 [Candidatus Schekmanbacteria bacterium]|nr:hypothetical protein [Candidatus Schekmanbacteria bacterium]
MTERFVLDEASWHFAPSDSATFSLALETLLERLDVASLRGEPVGRHSDFYETQIRDGPALYAALFDAECEVTLGRDLAERLRLALDHAREVKDEELSELDATIAGTTHLAPGVTWAHARNIAGHAVAILPFPVECGFSGRLQVRINDVPRELHFVTTEKQHRAFFRDAIEVEDMAHEALQSVAPSAFPDLDWVEGVWQDLRRYKNCFFGEHRKKTVLHLSVLDDEGSRLFHTHPGGQGVDAELAAQGVDASPENSKARGHKPSIDDRTRSYLGQKHVFWWHTKIRWNEGRIHFLHVPKKAGSERPVHGHIVVGIFKDHCVLPG